MMRYALFFTLMVLAVLQVSGLQAEDKDNKTNVDTELQKKIDTAIQKGAEYLLKHWKDQPKKNESYSVEGEKLVYLYALLHADLPIDKLKEPLRILQTPITTYELYAVYAVPIRIFVLNLLDPVKYQNEIAECTQFLIDTQTSEGQWDYPSVGLPKPAKAEKATVTPTNNGKSVTEQLPKIKLTRNTTPNWRGGNNSSTQFALLGLSAAAQANIEIPKEVWERSLKLWQEAQCQDGGWGYKRPQDFDLRPSDTPYGSMTCAGISSLVICLRQLGKNINDIKKDKHIQDGLIWMQKNFSLKENPLVKRSDLWKDLCTSGTPCFYYYLYSLERAMTFSETEMLEKIDWYKEGARYLVSRQDKDGGWRDLQAALNDVTEPPALRTAYAILFLKRASRVYITPLGRGKAVVTPSSPNAPNTPPSTVTPPEKPAPDKP